MAWNSRFDEIEQRIDSLNLRMKELRSEMNGVGATLHAIDAVVFQNKPCVNLQTIGAYHEEAKVAKAA